MLSHEGIRRAKGVLIKMPKLTVPFIKPTPEEMSLSGGNDIIALIQKWCHSDQEEKSMIRED